MPLPHSKGGRCPPFESLSPRRQLQTRFAFALSTNETQSKRKPRLQFLCKSKRKQTAFALPSGKANQLQTESNPIAKQLQTNCKAVQGFVCFSFAFRLLFEFLQNSATISRTQKMESVAPANFVVVRSTGHSGSRWLAELLSTQNLSFFFEFSGRCPERYPLANASLKALFELGCDCRLDDAMDPVCPPDAGGHIRSATCSKDALCADRCPEREGSSCCH